MADLERNQKTAVETLIMVVEQYVREHTPPLGQMPEGIRLEMHPNIRYMVFSNLPDRYRYLAAAEMPFPPQLPVRMNIELPQYAWRLVVITEDVINGGEMPHPDKGAT